jgi:ATP-dependent DNA helicase RecG
VSRIGLETKVQFVRGVGPIRAKHFAGLGVETVGDLLEYLPFRYERLPSSVPIGDLLLDETATIIGSVRWVDRTFGRSRAPFVADVVDGTGSCSVRWFNAPFVEGKVVPGATIRITGKVTVRGDEAEFVNPQFRIIDDQASPFADDVETLEPVYPAASGLNSKVIAKILGTVLSSALGEVNEFLPEPLRTRRSLTLRRTSLERVHCPTKIDDTIVARRRLAYDELLLSQLAIQSVRRRRQMRERTTPITTTAKIDERIRSRFPFQLTPGQESAVREIVGDLARPSPMNRLLQGDVGSGKTAVALYAALSAIANRRQVALLVPTEVLAEQHFEKISQYLAGSRVRFGLLTGKLRKKERTAIVAQAEAGEIDLLIGTHAVIQKSIRFRDLGLVIIDEQHKFGVIQRAALRAKGRTPHCLVMTATPIPRTLTMTFFGDLDVSTIRDAPPGRQPITTRMVSSSRLDDMWGFVRQRFEQGDQAYIVYPLIDESESLNLKAASTEVEKLRSSALRDFRVELLHGRLKNAERDAVMADFRAGEVHALVTTTVIEVGVDVANAAIMIVEQAERFGLSQLHQLRGRVGRGSRKSYCFLVSDSFGAGAKSRLGVLCQTTDGFRVAEEDLKIRGPGELLGTRQHGLPQFRVANLVEDVDLLELARDDAAEIMRSDPGLRKSEHAPLRRELMRKFGRVMGLADVA